MKRRAFTLLELLLVVAIMSFMGTMAVGGYRAMRRGMEEKSAVQNVNQFIRAAYQRAQIDRQPVAVYLWNETQREGTGTKTPIVVGKAVAVRRAGRLTKVPGGDILIDEFGDLRFNRLVLSEDDDDGNDPDPSGKSNGVFLYRMNGDEGSQLMRSTVDEATVRRTDIAYVGGRSHQYETYAFRVQTPGGVQWKAGDAYGFEFADLTLPNNYIFGSDGDWSRSVTSPVSGEGVIRFNVRNGAASASGGTSDTVVISSLRPGSGGKLKAQEVATSDSPTKQMDY